MDRSYADLAKQTGREYRFRTQPLEVRADGDDGTVEVEGYAAKFDVVTDIGWFREVIRPGAFSSAIQRGDDVVFNYNHDFSAVMARTTSNSLELTEDDTGLKIRATLDLADTDVQRIVPKMRRGDIQHMSFAFMTKRAIWEESDNDDVSDLRQIMDLELFDVSAVTFPAYDETEIGLRARQEYKSSKGDDPVSALQRRARRLHLARHGRVIL